MGGSAGGARVDSWERGLESSPVERRLCVDVGVNLGVDVGDKCVWMCVHVYGCLCLPLSKPQEQCGLH